MQSVVVVEDARGGWERLLLPASCSRSPLSGEAGDGAAELPRGLELDALPSLSSPCFAPPRAPPCRGGGSARRSGRRCELDIELGAPSSSDRLRPLSPSWAPGFCGTVVVVG
jgi:hypothetical protein